MGARGDVEPVLGLVAVEGVAAGPVIERAVDLFKVPGVADRQLHQVHYGLGADRGDVLLHQPGQVDMRARVEQLHAGHHHVFMLGDGDRGPPFAPAARAAPAVELGAEKADDGDGFHRIGWNELALILIYLAM